MKKNTFVTQTFEYVRARRAKSYLFLIISFLFFSLSSCQSSNVTSEEDLNGNNSWVGEEQNMITASPSAVVNRDGQVNNDPGNPGDMSPPTLQDTAAFTNTLSENQMELITQCVQPTNTIRSFPNNNSGVLIASIPGTSEGYVIGKLTSDLTWKPIPDSQYVSYSLSPNAEMLAILSPHDELTTLKIIYLDEAPEEVEIQNSLQEIMWFGNTYLTLISTDHSKTKSLFEPFTDQTKPFPLILDEQINDLYLDVVWLSPQGTSVVYLQTSEDFRSYYSRERYAVYDYENSTTITTGLSWTPGGVDWSAEGDLVAVVSIGELHPSRQIPSQEIFTIDPLTGQTQQLTNFVELLGGVFIESIEWSPDKKYMLVDVNPIEESLSESFQRELYLVDLQSNYLIDLCLDDVSEGYYYWSLDGKYIAWTERSSGDLYLLEVVTGLTLIVKNSEASLIGWMK